MSDRDSSLENVTVGIFVAQKGTEEVEFTEPKRAVSNAGAEVEVVSSEPGNARTVNDDFEESDSYAVDAAFEDVSPDDYDALIVPGGTVGADTLRLDDDAVSLVRDHLEGGKPAAGICHGPWVFVEAGVVDGRRLTSYPSLETDVRNAGGTWVDEEVVVDDGLVTSRDPDDLDAFCEAILDEFATVAAAP